MTSWGQSNLVSSLRARTSAGSDVARPHTTSSSLRPRLSNEGEVPADAAVAAERERRRVELDRSWQRAESKAAEAAAALAKLASLDALLRETLPHWLGEQVRITSRLLGGEEEGRVAIMEAEQREAADIADNASISIGPRCVVVAARDSGLMRELVATQRRLADLERSLLAGNADRSSSTATAIVRLSDLACRQYVVVGSEDELRPTAHSRPPTSPATYSPPSTAQGTRKVRRAPSKKPKRGPSYV